MLNPATRQQGGIFVKRWRTRFFLPVRLQASAIMEPVMALIFPASRQRDGWLKRLGNRSVECPSFEWFFFRQTGKNSVKGGEILKD